MSKRNIPMIVVIAFAAIYLLSVVQTRKAVRA